MLGTFASCNSDDLVSDSQDYIYGAYNYNISVANDNSDIQLTLDSLKSVIVDVQNAPSWLTIVPQDTLNSDSFPVITLKVKEAADGLARKCRIFLTAASQEKVVLNVSQDDVLGDRDNAIEIDPEFLNNWENMEFLSINDGGKLDTEIDAPWNEDAASTLMPEEICMDVKKKDGWEVAFSLMNQRGHADKNYFGLYNKYTGVLRIFYYCNKDVTGAGSDFAFEILLGTGNNSNPVFYNTLRYGIPTDAKVDANVDIRNSGQAKTFYLLTTPYADMGQTTLYQGWHAFDIDMSAYTGKSFKTDGGNIKIACKTSTNASVNLGTDIMGKIYGELSGSIDRNSMVATADGVGGLLSNLSGMLGNTSQSSLASIEAAICDGLSGSLNKYSLWAASACNMAANAYNFLTGTETTIPKDSLHGKLELKTDATADTKGYITAQTANDVKQFTIKNNAFNGESNLGKGVWQITTSPTIYVIKDVILCNKRPYYYSSDDVIMLTDKNRSGYTLKGYNELRLPYFYDPTSFGVTINPELFPDAKNLKITTYCGIYANNGQVNNNSFRKAIGISKPDNQYILTNPGYWDWDTYFGYAMDGRSGRKFIICSPNDFRGNDVPFLKERKYFENGVSQHYDPYNTIGDDNKVHYYGQLVTLDKRVASDFLIEPQICYAHTSEKRVSYNSYFDTFQEMAEIPELYVIVAIQFESGGKTYSYSRTYLPKYENISKEEAKTKATDIEKKAKGQSNKLMINEYVTSIKKKVEVFNR